jgi:tetratricopeptide (TPR) repeat protein
VNLRKAFSSQEVLLSYFLDQSTDMNLMAGLPQQRGAETIAALRNLGSIDAAVGVAATNEKGEVLQVTAVIPALSFGQALFRTSEKITRVEVDPEKYYPQVDFSDDVAPREFSESDPVLVIKRAFDKQDFIGAERNARLILKSIPHFDDARILLARSLQAQGKLTDAEQEYRGVLNEKVPTARSLAWANVGLGEILSRTDQKQAVRFFDDAIKCEADYGAALGARLGRNKIGEASATDESVRNFFAQFDKAVVSSSKASVQGLMVEGEVSRFAANVSGQAQAWQSRVLRIDRIDANCIAVETSLNVRLLNKGDESGTAVFELLRIGNVWKLGGVEMFEVR